MALSLLALAPAQQYTFSFLENNGGDDLTMLFPGVTLNESTVVTNFGPIVGRECPDGLSRFYGVPVQNSTAAAAPRFKYPIPLTPWTAPMQTTMIKHCYATEDCGAVEIATPTSQIGASSLMPVFVYFSGGGYIREANLAGGIMGMSFHPRYGITSPDDPTGKAVQVFAHYRMGPIGFLSHPGFDANGNGNWGLADGIAALQWISTEIAAFGGDKTRVSTQGSSAGGAYQMMLLASPLTVGLVTNYFAMSPYTGWEPAFFSMRAAQELGQMYSYVFCGATLDVPAVGSSDASDQAACLKNPAQSDFFANQEGKDISETMASAAYFTAVNLNASVTDVAMKFNEKYGTGFFEAVANYLPWNTYPNVDGYVLDLDPWASYRRGLNKAATVVMGHTPNEYSMLFSMPGGIASTSLANHQFILGLSTLPVTAGLADAWTAIQAAPDIATVTSAVYGSFVNSDFTGWTTNIQSATDVWFARGISESGKNLMLGGSTKVYKMLYAFGMPDAARSMLGMPYGGLIGAQHAPEDSANLGHWAFGVDTTGMAIGIYGYGGLPWTAPEMQFAMATNYYWKNVISTGSPNGDSSMYPMWPANSDSHMVLSPAYAAGAGFGGCIRVHPCLAESAASLRAPQLAYFNNPTGTFDASMGCVGSAPYVDFGASGEVTGTFGLTMPDYPFPAVNTSFPSLYSCSTCSCGSPERKTLFGAPSSRPTCSCA